MFHRRKLADPNVPVDWIESGIWNSWGSPLNAVRGESLRQDELWSLCAGDKPPERGYTICVEATIRREPTNPVDRNALRVEVNGMHVGYLAREIAARVSPGLDRAGCKHFVVPAVLRGGGAEAPSLGLHVWLDKRVSAGPNIAVSRQLADAFWVPWPPDIDRERAEKPTARGDDIPGIMTGASHHGGRWSALDGVDKSDVVKRAREFLKTEGDMLERHFAFNVLEQNLYKLRDLSPALLDEFQTVCEQHHAEMTQIRPALIDFFGGVPFVPMYRQMAVLLAKRKDWAGALEWCNRGLATYSDGFLERQWPADLEQRAAKIRAKMAG